MQRAKPQVPVGLVLIGLLVVSLPFTVGCGGSGGKGGGGPSGGGGGSGPPGAVVAPAVPLAPAADDIPQLYMDRSALALAPGQVMYIEVQCNDPEIRPLRWNATSTQTDVATVSYNLHASDTELRVEARDPGRAEVILTGTGPFAGCEARLSVNVYNHQVLKLWSKTKIPAGGPDLELAFLTPPPTAAGGYYRGYSVPNDTVPDEYEAGAYTFATPKTHGLPSKTGCPWFVLGSTIVGDADWEKLHEQHRCFAIRNGAAGKLDVREPVRFDLVFWDDSEQDNFAIYLPILGGTYKALGHVVVWLPHVLPHPSEPQIPPSSLYPDDSHDPGPHDYSYNIYRRCQGLPTIGVVHGNHIERGTLSEMIAYTRHERDGKFGQYHRVQAPRWQDPQTMYLSAGTVFAQVSSSATTPPPFPPDWGGDYVLAVRAGTVDTPEEESTVPGLCGPRPPPELGPPIANYATLVPFTAFQGTRVTQGNRWMRENSPFVRVERLSNYRCIEHVHNPTSVTQHGLRIQTTSGLTPGQSTTLSEGCGLAVSPDYGVEVGLTHAGLSAGVGSLSPSMSFTEASPMSASLSMGFGYGRPTGITQLQHATRLFELNVPPGTAVGFYQRYDRIRVTASDPTGQGMILGEVGYGCTDNYAYSQWPLPEADSSDSIVAVVPQGVELLTPWGEVLR